MKLKIKDMNIATGGPIIVILNQDDAKVLDFHVGDRIGIQHNNKKTVAILNFAESEKAVPRGRIGCYEVVLDKLHAKNNSLVTISLEEKPKSISYIKKKLNNEKLSYNELYTIVDDIVKNRLSDIEMTYFVSACHLNAMQTEETINLTKAMINTGEVLKFKKGPIMDKHCVGGVAGNRTTMVIVPILAAAGVTMPKSSSRSITSPSGTADTMEVLAGVSFSVKEVRKIVNKVGACIVWGGAINLAPADDRIIRVEHPLSIDSNGQLLASILAKKASVSAGHVLVDIPLGKGAKIEHRKKALFLKNQFEVVGRSAGMNIKVIITDGTQPIGNGYGPLLEARDVLWVLRNDLKGPSDLRKKSVVMAGLLLEMAGKAKKGQGEKKALEILESGKAYKKMQEMIKAQGGKEILPENLKLAKYSFGVYSNESGKIIHIDNETISKIARDAGAPLDKAAGVYLYHHKNDKIMKGEILYTIYSNSTERLEFARGATKETKGIEAKH